MDNSEKLWVEKFRPQSVSECILPEKLGKFFQGLVEQGDIPNLLLDGDAGCGKTTIAKALCREMDFNFICINASENGNIDTLRNDIRDFVSTVSLNGKKKVVILDEADHLNPQSTQPALRGFMEEFSSNARFILTCNFKNRILDPLKSRCTSISFTIPKKERSDIAKKFLIRTLQILKAEGVEYEKKVVWEVVKKFFPDFRRTLNELNAYGINGSIDGDIFAFVEHTPINELLGHMKDKDYNKVSDWVEENDFDQEKTFELFRKTRYDFIKDSSLPQFDMSLWQYADSSYRIQNPKINMQGFLVEVMSECEMK